MTEVLLKKKKAVLILFLLLFVIVSSTFIGSLAKYLAQNTATDETVTAKFGFDIPTTISLFSDSYTNVQADELGKHIIAPGTSGQATFEVTGTSEVAFEVAAEVKVTYSDAWDGYTPLEFSLDGTEWTALEEFETAMSSALGSETLSANDAYSNTQTIHWKWPFHTSLANDKKDTDMGLAATGETAPEVAVSIVVTAVQID